jgi:hypothetical protein
MNIQLTPKSLDVQTFTAIDGPSVHASRPVPIPSGLSSWMKWIPLT